MEINYVCSLGSFCHTSEHLKAYNMRYCSYPFDYVLSSPEMVTDCLKDDFTLFLDKSRYENCIINNDIRTNHKLYGNFSHTYFSDRSKIFNSTFRHHNLLDEVDYQGFIRKINRFRMLLKKTEPKLFLLFSQDEEYTKKQIDELNDMLKTKTTNYEICCITFLNDYHAHYTIEEYGNCKLVKAYMYSRTSGGAMLCPPENDFLQRILENYYKFNLKNDIKLE